VAETQATALVRLASGQGVDLFHDADQVTYATIPVGGHRETHMISTRGFRQWLARAFYVESGGKPPNRDALQTALNVIEAKALYDGPEHPVYVRVGGKEPLYLDLGTADWSVVEIGPFGWQARSDSPVRFRRPRGMLSLPVPDRHGAVRNLQPFVNLGGDEDFLLLVSVILAALRPWGPYPVLILQGEQGSAKSTLARVIKRIVDPCTVPLRTRPRDEVDLLVAANHGHMLTFDNLSELPAWLSDAFCRLATGGGLSKRQLYTDGDEYTLNAQRPMILNGIEDLAVRGDLQDRAIILTLPRIARYRDEALFWDEFEQALPSILGAVLDGVCSALATEIEVHLDSPPRMADFATWAVAGAKAFGWTPDAFLAAYTDSRAAATGVTLEASPLAAPLLRLMDTRENWSGTATELLTLLEQLRDQGNGARPDRNWPKAPHVASGILRRLAPILLSVKINVTFDDKARPRRLTIARVTDPDVSAQQRRQRASEASGLIPSVASRTSPAVSGEGASERAPGTRAPAAGPVPGDASDAGLRAMPTGQPDSDPDDLARAAMREGA